MSTENLPRPYPLTNVLGASPFRITLNGVSGTFSVQGLSNPLQISSLPKEPHWFYHGSLRCADVFSKPAEDYCPQLSALSITFLHLISYSGLLFSRQKLQIDVQITDDSFMTSARRV